MSDTPEYVIDRVFDAPRDMVWRAWTDPELLAQWYGPRVETIIHEFDLTPGGLWLNEMKMGDKSHLSRSEFMEIVPLEKLVWHQSNTDKAWNIISNPMMPDWPRVIATIVTFADAGAKTKVRLVWTPHEATDAEIACFAGAMDGFGKGWGAGFAILDEMLAELQRDAG